MAVRQRVSTVLKDEALIVERIEAQFCHFNGVEDVIGGLERVKFCHGIYFFPSQNCQKVSMVDVLFYNVFLYAICLFCDFFPQSNEYIFALNQTNSLGARRPVSDLNLPSTR